MALKKTTKNNYLKTLMLSGLMLFAGSPVRAGDRKGPEAEKTVKTEVAPSPKTHVYNHVSASHLKSVIERTPEAGLIRRDLGIPESEVARTLVYIAGCEAGKSDKGFPSDIKCWDPASTAVGFFQINKPTEEFISKRGRLPPLDRENLNTAPQIVMQARYGAALYRYNLEESTKLAEVYLGPDWSKQKLLVEDDKRKRHEVAVSPGLLVSAAQMGLGNLEDVFDEAMHEKDAVVLRPQVDGEDFTKHFLIPSVEPAYDSVKHAKNYLKRFLAPHAAPESVEGLTPEMSSQLAQLYQAMPENIRKDLKIGSGKRSFSRQMSLWQKALKKYKTAEVADNHVARPGHSHHEKGLAVDFRFESKSARKWVEKHAGEFGLGLGKHIKHEYWHYELIAPHNTAISKFSDRAPDEDVVGNDFIDPSANNTFEWPEPFFVPEVSLFSKVERQAPVWQYPGRAVSGIVPEEYAIDEDAEPLSGGGSPGNKDRLVRRISPATDDKKPAKKPEDANQQDRYSVPDSWKRTVDTFQAPPQEFVRPDNTAHTFFNAPPVQLSKEEQAHFGKKVKIDHIHHTIDENFVLAMRQAYGDNAHEVLADAMKKKRGNPFRANANDFEADSAIAGILHGPRFTFSATTGTSSKFGFFN